MLAAMSTTGTDPLNIAEILPSDEWPQVAVTLIAAAGVIVLAGIVAAVLYERIRKPKDWKVSQALVAVCAASALALSMTSGYLQGDAQRASIAGSETAFRQVLDDRYGASTGASFKDVLDAAEEDRPIVLTRDGESTQVTPHRDGDVLTFFSADGAEYTPSKAK